MKIEELAYLKWETAGKPDGKALEFWLEAEQEIATRKRKKYKRKTKITTSDDEPFPWSLKEIGLVAVNQTKTS